MGAYRISNTHPFSGDLAADLLGYPPQSAYHAGAERVVTLAGLIADLGYPRVTWTFKAVTVAQWEDLLDLVGAYSGTVYIETRNDVDAWAEWQALARLPEPHTLARRGGYYLDVTLEFLLLVDVTPA